MAGVAEHRCVGCLLLESVQDLSSRGCGIGGDCKYTVKEEYVDLVDDRSFTGSANPLISFLAGNRVGLHGGASWEIRLVSCVFLSMFQFRVFHLVAANLHASGKCKLEWIQPVLCAYPFKVFCFLSTMSVAQRWQPALFRD